MTKRTARSEAAAALGRVKSSRKARTSRENIKKAIALRWKGHKKGGSK